MNNRESLKELFAASAEKINFIQWGEVDIWYDNAGHYCDVIWLSTSAYFDDTEHPEVMALVDNAHNLYGFKIDCTIWMGDAAGGYTAVDLRSRLQPAADAVAAAAEAAATDGVVVPGVIRARYDHEAHSFEVRWGGDDAPLTATDTPHILAAADAEGRLCGFRVINIDQLSDDEFGMAHTRLPVRLAARAGR